MSAKRNTITSTFITEFLIDLPDFRILKSDSRSVVQLCHVVTLSNWIWPPNKMACPKFWTWKPGNRNKEEISAHLNISYDLKEKWQTYIVHICVHAIYNPCWYLMLYLQQLHSFLSAVQTLNYLLCCSVLDEAADKTIWTTQYEPAFDNSKLINGVTTSGPC
jgi:hypothetical protein